MKHIHDEKGYCVKIEINGRSVLIDGDNPYQLRRRVKEVVQSYSENQTTLIKHDMTYGAMI